MLCFYDNPIGMRQVAFYNKRSLPHPDDCMSGGHLIMKALRKRGLNPDDFLFTIWETAETSKV